MGYATSDGQYFEDDLDLASAGFKEYVSDRPKITVRPQHPFDQALDHLKQTPEAPLPQADPRGSRPTYSEGDTIPGADSYGNQTLGGQEYKKPLLPPSTEEPAKSPIVNPEKVPLDPPTVAQTGSQDASVEPINDRTRVISEGELPPIGPDSSSSKNRSIWDQLTGNDGGERYQLWPEKAVREVLDNVRTFMTTEPGSEANIQASTRMAFDLGLGGLATAGTRPNSIGVFGGLSGAAKTSVQKLEKLEEAEKLFLQTKGEGGAASNIWGKTGWWRDPRDNQWKFEIPDNKAKIDHDILEPMLEAKRQIKLNLGDILGHAPLYKAYPDLKKLEVIYDPKLQEKLGPQVRAEHWPPYPEHPYGKIKIGPKFLEDPNLEQRSTILHEVQHAVQAREGFVRGASTQNKTMSEYRKAGGEIEARNIEKREELRRQGKEPGFPRDTENLPDAQQMRINQASEMLDEQLKKFWPPKLDPSIANMLK